MTATDDTGLHRDMPAAITLQSGMRVDPFALQPADVLIADIAHALARQCRYLGHCTGFMSVARHSIRVSNVLERRGFDPKVQMCGLLHDASETYLGDIVRPLKHRPEFAPFREAEQRADRAVSMAFGLRWPWPDAVHDADNAVLLWELRIGRHEKGGDPLRDQRDFLKRYEALRRHYTEVGQP